MFGFQKEILLNVKNLESRIFIHKRKKKSLEKIRSNSDVHFFRQKH